MHHERTIARLRSAPFEITPPSLWLDGHSNKHDLHRLLYHPQAKPANFPASATACAALEARLGIPTAYDSELPMQISVEQSQHKPCHCWTFSVLERWQEGGYGVSMTLRRSISHAKDESGRLRPWKWYGHPLHNHQRQRQEIPANLLRKRELIYMKKSQDRSRNSNRYCNYKQLLHFQKFLDTTYPSHDLKNSLLADVTFHITKYGQESLYSTTVWYFGSRPLQY